MRIGELADRAGVSATTIRFYERDGLLPPAPRTAGGYRTYHPADAERLEFIKSAQRLGMRLGEIRETLAFRDRGEPPCRYVQQVLADQLGGIDRRIAELMRLRDALAILQDDTAGLPDDGRAGICAVIAHAAAMQERGAARRDGGDRDLRRAGHAPRRSPSADITSGPADPSDAGGTPGLVTGRPDRLRVDLLVLPEPDCPHREPALRLLRQAAADAGIADPSVAVHVITTEELASRLGFAGSPTFLINGADLFPTTTPNTAATCRIYPTSHGPAGLPDVDALRDALHRASSPPST